MSHRHTPPPSDEPTAARRPRPPKAEKAEQPQPRPQPTVSTTPFARVLTAWMWSKQPPWSAARLANALGMGRSRVSNWIYGNVEPELPTMMWVMEQLGIPTQQLIQAYAGASGQAPAAQPPSQAAPRPAPLSAEEAAKVAEDLRRHEWETMLEHTRTVMRLGGFSEAMISTMLAEVASKALDLSQVEGLEQAVQRAQRQRGAESGMTATSYDAADDAADDDPLQAPSAQPHTERSS